jgi:ribulose 1,5-bisphosphate carboxylase large subunit-like protein
MRDAWDAAMAGQAIDDAARTRPALQAALGFW